MLNIKRIVSGRDSESPRALAGDFAGSTVLRIVRNFAQ